MDRIAALRAYTRLVELGSFTAVAREMRLGQSTVSKWVAALEEEVGVQLVERTTRATRVTDAGREFYRRAQEVLDAWSSAVHEVAQTDGRLTGTLRVSLPTVFGPLIVVPMLNTFLRTYPDIALDLSFDDRYVRLVDDAIDVAVRVGVPVDSSETGRKLDETRRCLVASPAYLHRYGVPNTPADLEQHQCLLHSRLGGGQVWRFSHDGRWTPVDVTGRVSADHSAALLELACAGHGVALLAEWLVHAELARGQLVELLTDYSPPTAPISVLFGPGRRVSAAVRALVDFLVDEFSKGWMSGEPSAR